MAAVQLGIAKRIIYIKSTVVNKSDQTAEEDEKRVYVNPKIISAKGETYFWEACQSCLNEKGDYISGWVRRPYEIDIEFFDEKGQFKKETLKDFEATVFCHEYDHLDGILHLDRAEKIMAPDKKERRNMKKEPYTVISKD